MVVLHVSARHLRHFDLDWLSLVLLIHLLRYAVLELPLHLQFEVVKPKEQVLLGSTGQASVRARLL